MKRGTLFLLVTFLLGGCATTQERATPKAEVDPGVVPGSAKVFLGANGVRVAMVTPADAKPDEVLIRVTGSQTNVDNLVLPCRRRTRSRNASAWVTDRLGRQYWIVTIDRHRHTEADKYEVHLPSPYRNGLELSYDEAESKSLDAGAMIAAHRAQKADGTLSAYAEFNRPQEERQNEAELAEIATRANQACGTNVTTRIAWKTVSEETMKDRAMSGYCGAALDVMRNLCDTREAKAAFQGHVKELLCRFGDKQGSELASGRWSVTVSAEHMDSSRIHKEYLLVSAPLGLGEPLQERVHREKTRLCTDGKSHYVGLEPHERVLQRVIFGDGKKFIRMRVPKNHMVGDYFFDPREFNREGNPNWRGADLRYHSHLAIDDKKNTCELRCGQRKIPLERVAPEVAMKMLSAAEFTPPPTVREPYALARDRKGTYYYIDRSNKPDARDFHLYRGPKGNLKRLDMVNVVLDSEGDVFSTKTGTLRLIIEKKNSFWIRGKRSETLLNLAIHENLSVIYNELGVYLGVRLGTPCDDL